MRLAGVCKQGYYPAPPQAIAAVLLHLKPPPDPPPDGHLSLNILDPCAGEGKALTDIRQGLSLSRAYAVELNASRAERIRANHPEITLLGPASFHSSRISPKGFGLVYLNPPFDDEFGGGGREELAFLRRATEVLAVGGVLVFVLPFNQVFGQADMLAALDAWYERSELYLFPDGHRPYRECCIFGVRRSAALTTKMIASKGPLTNRFRYCWARKDEDVADFPRLGQPQYDHWKDGRPLALSLREEIDTWTIPCTSPPREFVKTDLTDEEIEIELAKSPLHDRLRSKRYAPLRRPPLPLNKGHTSMLLLTGLLDGYVPADPPHVVRAHCGKEERLARTESHVTPNGTQVDKRIFSEQPRPVVRAVWADGVIRTFAEGMKPADTPTPKEEEIVIEDEGDALEDDDE
jgi:hypothetical protein